MADAPTPIDQTLLKGLSAAAAERPRRRLNHNFHSPEEETANRLLNAVEPGSYIQPHRHLEPSKNETMVVVSGRFGFVFFDDEGQVVQTLTAGPGEATVGVDIPHGAFHSVVALQPGSVFFEAKAGPYRPLIADEKAPWAPAEGEDGAEDYRAFLESQFSAKGSTLNS
jgi:cupin fold WbuC family metalloprotein